MFIFHVFMQELMAYILELTAVNNCAVREVIEDLDRIVFEEETSDTTM